MERMKCRHKAVLKDGLPNIYVQVGPKAPRGSGFDGCIMCLDMGIAYNEQGLESARASMAAMLDGIATGNDPEGVLYQRDRDAAQQRTTGDDERRLDEEANRTIRQTLEKARINMDERGPA